MTSPIDGTCILLSVMVFFGCVPDVMPGKGTLFLVAFSKETDGARFYLGAVLRGQGSAVVTVTTPESSAPEIGTFRIQGSDKADLFEVNSPVVAEKSGPYSGNCIKIESTSEISVIVFTFASVDDTLYSCSSFLALPLDQLSTYYITVTSCPSSECFILVASHEDNNEVKVRLSALNATSQASDIFFNGKTYNHGSVFSEILQAWGSFQILSNAIDLTGTLVSSAKPIAVYSGGVFGKSLHSQNLDKTIEQMPPVKSLETTFVLRGPDVDLDWRYTVRVAKPHPDTTVDLALNGGHYNVVESRDDQEIYRMNVGETIVITANNPILVIMGSPEKDGSSTEALSVDASVDPSFVLAIPETLWFNGVRVYLFNPLNSAVDVKHQAVLVTSAACTQQFQKDNKAITDIQWKTTGDYKSGIVSLPDAGTTAVRISNRDCPFGGYMLGYYKFGAWTYPFEWNADTTDLEDPGPVLQPLPDQQERHSSSARISSTRAAGSSSDTSLESTTGTRRDTSQAVPRRSSIQTSTQSHIISTVHTATTKYTSKLSPTTENQAPSTSKTETSVTPSISAGHSVSHRIITISTSMSTSNTLTTVSERTTSAISQSKTSSTEISATPVSQTPINQMSSTSQIIQNSITSPSQRMPTQVTTPTDTITQSSPTPTLSHVSNSHTDTITIVSTSTLLYSNQHSISPDTATISPEIAELIRNANSYTLVLCPCECEEDLTWIANMTEAEKEEDTNEKVRRLQINKSTLSKQLRTKTSAQDERPGPTYYGSFITGVLFVSLLSFIIIPDLLHAIYYVSKVMKKPK